MSSTRAIRGALGGWRRWILLATAVLFTGDALCGDNRPTWERVVKGLLAGGFFIGDLIELGRRHSRRDIAAMNLSLGSLLEGGLEQ